MVEQKIVDMAIAGDEGAMNSVVCYYAPYIKTICTAKTAREDGTSDYGVDREMEGEIITHLLTAISRLGE